MPPKASLKTVLIDSIERPLPKLWGRSQEIPLDTEKIVVLSGVRRSGKTYHLFHLIQQLRARGVKAEQVVYVNFEDERLDLTLQGMSDLLGAYQELFPEQDLADCYFFFDEIQEVAGWEKFVARLYHSVSKHVFVTGSNAKLLSREIATALRGRTVTFEVFPFSFEEFVGVHEAERLGHSSADRARLQAQFEAFLHQGGFPELLRLEQRLHRQVLQEYFDVMLFRDLIERYEISQPSILKYFCKRVIGTSGTEFSTHKIFNELKSQGYSVGKNTVYELRDQVESIYLNQFIQKYDPSVVKREQAAKKNYVIDQGLGAALDYKFSQDTSRLFETTIAMELRKATGAGSVGAGREVTYLQNGFECDFVVLDAGRVTDVIQASVDISDTETREREVRGAVRAANRFDLSSSKIVTLADQPDTIKQDGVTVEVVPAIEYCYFNYPNP